MAGGLITGSLGGIIGGVGGYFAAAEERSLASQARGDYRTGMQRGEAAAQRQAYDILSSPQYGAYSNFISQTFGLPASGGAGAGGGITFGGVDYNGRPLGVALEGAAAKGAVKAGKKLAAAYNAYQQLSAGYTFSGKKIKGIPGLEGFGNGKAPGEGGGGAMGEGLAGMAPGGQTAFDAAMNMPGADVFQKVAGMGKNMPGMGGIMGGMMGGMMGGGKKEMSMTAKLTKQLMAGQGAMEALNLLSPGARAKAEQQFARYTGQTLDQGMQVFLPKTQSSTGEPAIAGGGPLSTNGNTGFGLPGTASSTLEGGAAAAQPGAPQYAPGFGFDSPLARDFRTGLGQAQTLRGLYQSNVGAGAEASGLAAFNFQQQQAMLPALLGLSQLPNQIYGSILDPTRNAEILRRSGGAQGYGVTPGNAPVSVIGPTIGSAFAGFGAGQAAGGGAGGGLGGLLGGII
jgi:hypothetical protein